MKKNEILTTNANATVNNAVVTLGGVNLADYANRLGYDVLHTNRESDGKVAVSVYDKDGKEVVTSLESMSDENLASLNFVEGITNLNEVSPVMLAWHIHSLREFADDCGFTSVGAYIESSVNGRLKANYSNQLANVAKTFMRYDDELHAPVWLYDWCNHVPVSNLALILGEYNKCGDEPTFRERFIECAEPLPLRNQNKLKERLKTMRGTDSKSKSKSKEQEQEQEQEQGKQGISLATAYAMVHEYLLTIEEVETGDMLIDKESMEHLRHMLKVVMSVALDK